ncbi:MAG: hypothetical protein IJM88_00490 [Bacteroidales bacterium]|nr:hypothetical protein [Bacteroidales bacterium]
MKKIFTLAAAILLAQTMLFAQSGKSVSEKDVPERYVKDFIRLSSNAPSADWYMVDTLVFDAYYTTANGNKSALRFSPKGTETRWFINEKYYPHGVVNQVKQSHPNYKIKELYILSIKNKSTYQVLVGQRKGLFTKKWKNMRLMNFETDGKFIDEIEL